MHTGAGVEPLVKAVEVERALRALLNAEGVAEATLSVAYVSDPEIAALNEQFLHHAGPTDVLSFALHGPGEPPHGDIYIGADQALRQATELGVPAHEEWIRLAFHGALHVLGYDHPEGEDRGGSPMYVRQEELLARWLDEAESR